MNAAPWNLDLSPQVLRGMTEMLKYLSGGLRRYYDAIVQRPMPWRMIDKLASLEEADERRERTSSLDDTAGDTPLTESRGDQTQHR